MKIYTERQATGKYDVLTIPPYPRRVGFITGAKSTWLAESGRHSLGYFKTKAQAMAAIAGYTTTNATDND